MKTIFFPMLPSSNTGRTPSLCPNTPAKNLVITEGASHQWMSSTVLGSSSICKKGKERKSRLSPFKEEYFHDICQSSTCHLSGAFRADKHANSIDNASPTSIWFSILDDEIQKRVQRVWAPGKGLSKHTIKLQTVVPARYIHYPLPVDQDTHRALQVRFPGTTPRVDWMKRIRTLII